MYRSSLPPPSPLAAPGAPSGAIHLAPDLALAQRRALVVQLLAAGEPDLELGSSILEVNAERDQCEPALGDLPGEPADLAAVQQQLAITLGIVIRVGPVAVRADMAAEEPDLVVS